MPFVARCYRCGYILWTLTRDILKIAMEYHDIHSHKDYDNKDYCTWTITSVSHAIFYMLERMSKFPAFWKAVRVSHKQLASLFSG